MMMYCKGRLVSIFQAPLNLAMEMFGGSGIPIRFAMVFVDQQFKKVSGSLTSPGLLSRGFSLPGVIVSFPGECRMWRKWA